MKTISTIFIIILYTTLTACGSGENIGSNSINARVIAILGCETGDNAITGCWLSSKCDEAVFNNLSLGRWVDKAYHFRSDGTTRSIELQYDNANCSGTPQLSPLSPFPDSITYTDLGVSELVEGLQSYGITLSDSILGNTYVAGYLITLGKELCFTSNIKLGALYNSFSEFSINSSFDLNDCLLSTE